MSLYSRSTILEVSSFFSLAWIFIEIKVKLPGSEDYSGRFTGLTPYQAANKALSKYFRENKNIKNKISFTIKESTRSSKRGEYTYTGKRVKLDEPIQYSIGEGKLITKKYKNKLTKVKKGSKVTV